MSTSCEGGGQARDVVEGEEVEVQAVARHGEGNGQAGGEAAGGEDERVDRSTTSRGPAVSDGKPVDLGDLRWRYRLWYLKAEDAARQFTECVAQCSAAADEAVRRVIMVYQYRHLLANPSLLIMALSSVGTQMESVVHTLRPWASHALESLTQMRVTWKMNSTSIPELRSIPSLVPPSAKLPPAAQGFAGSGILSAATSIPYPPWATMEIATIPFVSSSSATSPVATEVTASSAASTTTTTTNTLLQASSSSDSHTAALVSSVVSQSEPMPREPVDCEGQQPPTPASAKRRKPPSRDGGSARKKKR